MSDLGAIRAAIEDIRAQRPHAVRGCGLSEGQPPSVQLAAWADDDARNLHQRFPGLGITLGVLGYPDGGPERAATLSEWLGKMATLSPDELGTDLDGPLTVPSGHSARHTLLVTNPSRDPVVLHTNGMVTGFVFDAGGELVGLTADPQGLPLIVYEVAPGATVSVPLAVGTAGVDRNVGYVVPPGEWAVRVVVPVAEGAHLGSARNKLSPPLPITVSS